MSWWTSDRQAYALSYLVNNGGLTPMGAAGLVSRWMNVEASQGPSSVNPFSGAFGIAQWLGSRLSGIRGNTDFDSQLAYAIQELNSSESRAGDVLRTAQTADQAATGASMYERAEGYSSATGRDNYTQRTANGIAAVLSNGSGNAGNAGTIYDAGNLATVTIPISFDDPNAPQQQPQQASVAPVLLLGLAGLLLYLVTE